MSFSVVSSLHFAHITDCKKEKNMKWRLLKNTTFTEDFRKHFISHLYFWRDIGRHKNDQSIIAKRTVFFGKSETLGIFFHYGMH